MSDMPSQRSASGDDEPSESEVDPRFDDAAAGTDPPRGAPAADPMKTAQEQFADIAAACGEWVRGKPMQALAVAAGVGFLIGRSGR